MTSETSAENLSSIFGGAMPKEEIGALRFLQQYPEYDGRGVVVAIFDTGVDPGAAGLQTTSDGKPKIIDVLDCTGSGDVDTSFTTTAEDGSIQGLSGRKLQLNPDWTNPTGVWHLGLKHAFELFPKPLVDRIKEKRSKRWKEQQSTSMMEATAALAAFDKANPNPSKLTEDQKKLRAELEARIPYLKDLDKTYEDFGPVIDCVVWHDGSTYRAALDTSALYPPGSTLGSLSSSPALATYNIELQYGTFSDEDTCNYACNVYDDGNLLSIVVDAGAHGTHVAGITAAHFPDDPDLNGVAPGAQIISCKIGDTRLGSMETCTGLSRALVACCAASAHIINMSYGEPTSSPGSGRFVELATELVNKHGVVFVASAGNAGPALSTVGAPGGTCAAIFGIGAYVSETLAAAGHSVLDPAGAERQYTWSSRGPAFDGDVGVAFSAPGGAISPVPTWTLQKRQLMNGTSMSSPNACGGIALLLSALEARGWRRSPHGLRQAIEASCRPLGGAAPDAVLTYGRGLLQVDAAWRLLERAAAEAAADVRFEVSVSWRGRQQRGLYLREPGECCGRSIAGVTVTPKMHEDADNALRLQVEEKLLLSSSAPWLTCPPALLLHHSPRSFDIMVNTAALPAGLHYGEVLGCSSAAPWRGALFRVPVTVVKPQQVDGSVALGPLEFGPGREHRAFVAAPTGATWAELTIKAGPYAHPCSFMVRGTQLRPETRYTESEYRSYMTLSPQAEHTAAFQVVGGATLEVTVSQHWSSAGDSSLTLELAFHGVNVEGSLALSGADGMRRVHITAPLRRQKVKPEAKLTSLDIPMRPASSTIVPLPGPRDSPLPNGRTVYRCLLTYNVSLTEPGKYTPCVPLLNKYVYDGVVDAQFLTLHEAASKRRRYAGDIYPSEVQLAKGDYTARLVLRHDSHDLLDKLTSLPLVMRRKLDPAVAVPMYSSMQAAVTGGTAVGELALDAGDRAALFLGPVPDDKLPADAAGRVLTGELALGVVRRGSGAAPAKLPLSFAAAPKAAAGGGGGGGSETGGWEEKLAEAEREARLRVLRDAAGDGGEPAAAFYQQLLQQLRSQYAGHLLLLLEHLRKRAAPSDVIAAADDIIAQVDQGELARQLGLRCDDSSEAGKAARKQVEDKKAALVEALAAKCAALVDLEAPGDAVEVVTSQLRQWVDTAGDVAHAQLHARLEARAGRPVAGLRALDKLVASGGEGAVGREVWELRAALLAQAGWQQWAGYEREMLLVRFPRGFPPL